MATFNSVSDLKPFKCMWKIKIKIIRLWKQYSATVGETIEMVLIDQKGTKIHATIKKEFVHQFEPFLSEGGSRIIINFNLSHSCGSYKTTTHPYKISFLATTRIRNCDQLPMELNGIQPINYSDILNGSLDPDYLVDVIGQIMSTTHIEDVAVNGKDTKKITLEIRNTEDKRLTMVLWGQFALDVHKAAQNHSDSSMICVMRFGKIKVWKEKYSVSNAYNVSVVAVNPQILEVQSFLSLLPNDNLSLAIVDNNPLNLYNGAAEKADFFVHTSRKTIQEVVESKQVEMCIVMGTIAGIDRDMGWYYLSCKTCSKKVLAVPKEDYLEDDDDLIIPHNYYCSKCKSDDPQILPRYKLHVIVVDNTGETKLLLFDNLATQLIQQPALLLTGPVNAEMQESDELPKALTNLIGKTFLFKISIMRDNFVYKHDTYKVLKIITNNDMIKEFMEKKNGDEVVENKESTQDTMGMLGHSDSIISEAPEDSLTLTDGESKSNQTRYGFSTPTKRKNLLESFDENSVTKNANIIKIKKEKVDKNG